MRDNDSAFAADARLATQARRLPKENRLIRASGNDGHDRKMQADVDSVLVSIQASGGIGMQTGVQGAAAAVINERIACTVDA